MQVSRREKSLGSKHRGEKNAWFNGHGARERTLTPHSRHTLGTLSVLAPLLRRGRVEELGGARGREVRQALHQSDIQRQPLDVNTTRHQFFLGEKRAMHQPHVKRQPNGRKNACYVFFMCEKCALPCSEGIRACPASQSRSHHQHT